MKNSNYIVYVVVLYLFSFTFCEESIEYYETGEISGRGNLIDDPSGWEIKNSLYFTTGMGIQLKILKNRTININIALNQSGYPNLLSPIFRMMYISFDII